MNAQTREDAMADYPCVELGPIAHGGHCVARLDGRVVFVRYGIPGERARVRITDDSLRRRIHALVDEERPLTAAALGERGEEFLALKVEGILDCAELFVVALCEDRERHVFGRRTLPQMDLASVSCAIQNLWLAARSEGLGVGWVSLFDPQRLADLLAMPAGAEPVAILCLGPVPEFPERPALELDGWAFARPLPEFVSENRWDRLPAESPKPR